MVCQRSSKGFIKEKETNGLLSKFGIKTLMSNVPILADIFFKDTKWINKFLLVGDKYMSETHLNESGLWIVDHLLKTI